MWLTLVDQSRRAGCASLEEEGGGWGATGADGGGGGADDDGGDHDMRMAMMLSQAEHERSQRDQGMLDRQEQELLEQVAALSALEDRLLRCVIKCGSSSNAQFFYFKK